MSHRILHPDGWPRARGYANGVSAQGRQVFVAGQIGWNERGELAGAEFVTQARQALRNIVAILAEAGAGPEHICRMTWYVGDRHEYNASLKELGAVGFMQPLKVSCADHEGGGAVKFLQWDGDKWKVISDWMQPDKKLVRGMIEESAAKYSKEKNITPRDCSKES